MDCEICFEASLALFYSFWNLDCVLMLGRIIGVKVPGQIGCSECMAFSHEKGIYPRINSKEFQLEDINEKIALLPR